MKMGIIGNPQVPWESHGNGNGNVDENGNGMGMNVAGMELALTFP